MYYDSRPIAGYYVLSFTVCRQTDPQSSEWCSRLLRTYDAALALKHALDAAESPELGLRHIHAVRQARRAWRPSDPGYAEWLEDELADRADEAYQRRCEGA